MQRYVGGKNYMHITTQEIEEIIEADLFLKSLWDTYGFISMIDMQFNTNIKTIAHRLSIELFSWVETHFSSANRVIFSHIKTAYVSSKTNYCSINSNRIRGINTIYGKIHRISSKIKVILDDSTVCKWNLKKLILDINHVKDMLKEEK